MIIRNNNIFFFLKEFRKLVGTNGKYKRESEIAKFQARQNDNIRPVVVV